MKVIDLLNKIANGEEAPKKIHIKNFQSDFIFNGYTYLSDEKEPQNIYWCLHSDALNYKVEILEEEKKIPEKLDIRQEKNVKNNWKWKVYGKEHSYNISTAQKIISDKLNDVIDYLKSKGE